jgi:hypothetical protein
MDSLPMPDCTSSAYWPLILNYVLPPVAALLSAIALWVASHARSTSQDAHAISAGVARRSDVHEVQLSRKESRRAALARKKP